MDDARLERLLTRPQGPRPAKPKRIADELRQMVTEDGPAPGEMLRTRPKPKAPKEPRIERGPNGRPKPPHGTDSRYKHHGCRCDKCEKAHKAAMRAYDLANRDRKLARMAAYRERRRARKEQAA